MCISCLVILVRCQYHPVQKNDQLRIQGLKYHEPVALVDQRQCKQQVIILDYIALVYLVASVDTEQQAQSRSTYHVQKTTNTTISKTA